MSTPIGNRKLRAFALFGAVGCLVAGLIGEGLLAATRQTGDSIIAPPKPKTDELTAAVAQPSPPVAPAKILPPVSPLAGNPVLVERLRMAKAHPGDVQISLVWHNRNDLDLYCQPPRGEMVSLINKKPKTGGWLDVDCNVSGTTTEPVEHIVWKTGESDPPLGEYKVWVKHYARHGGPDPTEFEVEIWVDGIIVRRFKSKLSRGTGVSPSSEILTFKVKPALRLGVPAEVAIHQGGKNRFDVLLERKRFTGEVTIPAQEVGPGLTIAEATIPADQKKGTIELTAAEDAAPGERTLNVLARSDKTGGTRTALNVKVLPVTPTLRMSAPKETVEVNQGGENRFTLRVGRGHFKGEVSILFEGDKEGLTLADQTVPADKDSIEVPLSALEKATAGTRQLTIKAAGPRAFTTTPLQVRINQVSRTESAWSWSELLRTCRWTGLLAMGLALALVCGQNHYMNRPLLNSRMIFIIVGSLAAGIIAGGLGQAIYAGLRQADLEPRIGFTIGWLLLGGALGRGVGFFIPNLDGWKASAAGAAGGLLAGLMFLLVSQLGGALVGRLLGAALLGMAIGLMVAWAEQTFRKFWLEVRYGTHEQRTVNLGPEPIKVGSDSRSCAVYVRGAPLVALRYWLSQGRIQCEDVPTKQTTEVLPDQPLQLGTITLTVRAATVAVADAAQPQAPVAAPTRPAPPPPPPAQPAPRLPEPATRQPARPAVGSACPKCGRIVDGPIGRRYCIVDDLTF